MSTFAGRRIRLFQATIVAIAIPALSGHTAALGDCTAQWVAGFGNPEGTLTGPVLATAVFDDGGGPALYAAGDFLSAGGATVNRIAKWNGSAWSPLGTGLDGTVRALAAFDDGSGPALYAGGLFTHAGGAAADHIAKWNGASWSAVSGGISGTVWALTVYNDGGGSALYAGGAFTTASGVAANRVAKWNGTGWSALGAGVGGIVRTLEVFDDGSGAALCAGGDFVTAGGVAAERMASWNGTAWSSLPGMNDTVWALRASGGSLYAGGAFTTAGGGAANRVARWNGSAWSAVGMGMNQAVYALTEFDDGSAPALYAAGGFTQSGGASTNRIARWNGSAWSAVAGGADGDIRTLAAVGNGAGARLFAGGFFGSMDGHAVAFVGSWNGTAWYPVSGGQGLDGSVGDLLVFDDGNGPALFAAGSFATAGDAGASSLARWSGSAWSSVGGDLVVATALGIFDDGGGPSLYAGIRSITDSHYDLAKWDGHNMVPFGAWLSRPIRGLVEFDDGTGAGLYVGGSFWNAGGVEVNGMAKWDGTAWSALDGGLIGNDPDCGASALAVFDDGNGLALYAGGRFHTAGGIAARNIAKWDGAAWSTLGTGVTSSEIYSLVVFDDGSGPALYAGGGAWEGDGFVAHGIARWNGTSWSEVGTGFSTGAVVAMAVFDDGSGPALYVAGYAIGGSPHTNRMAKWDGVAWQVIETGINGPIETLGVFDAGSGPLLFVGGNFTSAGGNPAFRIAAMSGCILSVEPPPAPGPVDPIDVPIDAPDDVISIPVTVPGSSLDAGDNQAGPDAAEIVDNNASAETETARPADEPRSPAAAGAGLCGMGAGLSVSGLLAGLWMMRRTGSRRRPAGSGRA